MGEEQPNDIESRQEYEHLQSVTKPNSETGARMMNQTLRHLDRSLNLIGLLSTWPPSKSFFGGLLLVYHGIIWVYVWGYFLWRFTSYHYGYKRRGDIPNGIALAVLGSLHLVFLKAGIMVYVSTKFALSRQKIIKALAKYRGEYNKDWFKPMERRSWKATIGVWISIVLVASVIIGLSISNPKMRQFNEDWVVFSTFPEIPRDPVRTRVLISYFIICVFHITCIIFSIQGIMIFLVNEVTTDFQQLNSEFAKTLKKGKGVSPDFHVYPQRHRMLTDIVSLLDDAFSSLVMIVFLCGIIIISFTLYTTICVHPYQSIDWTLTITLPIIGYYVGLMIVLAYIGTRLQDAVSQILCIQSLFLSQKMY